MLLTGKATKNASRGAFHKAGFSTETQKEYEQYCSYSFSILSGGNEPPLCKGRWIAQRDGRIVKAKFIRKTIPQPPTASAPFTQGSLWYVHPESPSAFPDKHCFCGYKKHQLKFIETMYLQFQSAFQHSFLFR